MLSPGTVRAIEVPVMPAGGAVPNLDLSAEELETLHDAVERFLECETKRLAVGEGDERTRALLDRSRVLCLRLHQMLAWGMSGSKRIPNTNATSSGNS
jgi:hypothetical protein